MAKVQIADVIVPEIFEKYVIQRTAVLSRVVQSGIVASDAEMDARANGGGQTVKMPFWNDLTGARQILNDTNPLTTLKIGADKDIAVLHNDGNAWSVNLLAELLSGDDPMGAIGDLLGNYWQRVDQLMLIAELTGVFAAFAAEGTPPNVLNIGSETLAGQSDDTKLTGTTFIDALQKLGDHSTLLETIAMHSVTESALRKRNLIDDIPDSQGTAMIATFQGRQVIVDDGCPVRNGTGDATSLVYTSYLFGPGAFAKGNASLNEALEGGFGTEGVEFTRTALASDSVLINRRRHILHPRGVRWNSAVMAGTSPTDAEIANAANWTRVYESKNVRIVAVTHNN